jgi:hypothetical protein
MEMVDISIELTKLTYKASVQNPPRSPVKTKDQSPTPGSPASQFRSFVISASAGSSDIGRTPLFVVKDLTESGSPGLVQKKSRSPGLVRKGGTTLNIHHTFVHACSSVEIEKTKISLFIISITDELPSLGLETSAFDPSPPHPNEIEKTLDPPIQFSPLSSGEGEDIDDGGGKSEIVCGEASLYLPSHNSSSAVQTHSLSFKSKKKKLLQSGTIDFTTRLSRRLPEITMPVYKKMNRLSTPPPSSPSLLTSSPSTLTSTPSPPSTPLPSLYASSSQRASPRVSPLPVSPLSFVSVTGMQHSLPSLPLSARFTKNKAAKKEWAEDHEKLSLNFSDEIVKKEPRRVPLVKGGEDVLMSPRTRTKSMLIHKILRTPKTSRFGLFSSTRD